MPHFLRNIRREKFNPNEFYFYCDVDRGMRPGVLEGMPILVNTDDFKSYADTIVPVVYKNYGYDYWQDEGPSLQHDHTVLRAGDGLPSIWQDNALWVMESEIRRQKGAACIAAVAIGLVVGVGGAHVYEAAFGQHEPRLANQVAVGDCPPGYEPLVTVYDARECPPTPTCIAQPVRQGILVPLESVGNLPSPETT